MPPQPLHIKKSDSWQMFDEISPKYDLLNHLLSFGLDIYWRNKLTSCLVLREKTRILDCATGTADVLLQFFKKNPTIDSAQGIDLAEKMLEIGRAKIQKAGLEKKITLQTADATQLPFEDNQFDNTTISFGIRNIPVPTDALKEMHRVLKPEGRALILEFSLPQNALIRFFHILYLRSIVPVIGWIFSGHYKAYKYLNQTIEDFPYGEAFCQLMKDSGFKNVKANQLLFGVATIYQGDKAAC